MNSLEWGQREVCAAFRAIMWLGRIDLPIADARRLPEGAIVLELRRRNLELACGLSELMTEREKLAWHRLDEAMATFVGPTDAMSPPDVAPLYRDLGVHDLRELAGLSDKAILDAIEAGHYGEQRILSQIAYEQRVHPTPLPRAFSFTGQRYTVDAHVLGDLVHDHVPYRLMPNPLDVAYAVFDNVDAKRLLAPQPGTKYADQLEVVHGRVDRTEPPQWDASLYTLWLGAIRGLSPSAPSRLPAALDAQAWGRRIVATQLASWAELRHDSILYAKQSYTVGISCSFPDAYVDPYPLFYERLASFAHKGAALVDALNVSAGMQQMRMKSFFGRLEEVAHRLQGIAEKEVRAERLSAADLAFVNGAVAEEQVQYMGCGGPPPRAVHGWYIDLFYGYDALDFKPTIADVHTQPTDLGGTMVGRVLHVGTAHPRAIVVDVGDGTKPRPFVGIVSSYAEATLENFQRYTDEEWRRAIGRGNPDDVPWMRDLVER